MPAATDVILVLKQARDGRMAKAKLIEVIVARDGAARREETTREVEKVLEAHIAKGRIGIEKRKDAEYLILK